MADYDENDFEVDEEVFQSKDMGNLGNIHNFHEALERYGYKVDDNISRRDLVVIYQKSKYDLSQMMNKYAKNGNYDAALEWKQRLSQLRSDFDARIQVNISNKIDHEHNQFDVAKQSLKNQEKHHHDSQIEHVDDLCHQKEIEHSETYRVRWEILEENISAMKLPRVKYSPRMIDLVNAEAHLNKLMQFDEARRVRLMIDKLKPIEDRANEREFYKKIDMMRNNLRCEEERDRKKLDEILKTIRWKDIRQRQHDRQVTRQRFANHERDMSHSHKHELHLRPETSIQPSALWTKRKGHDQTSSFHRGRQLLCVSKGMDVIGGGELADSIINRHNFNEPLDGTITRYEKKEFV
jgi:hypothetical protein